MSLRNQNKWVRVRQLATTRDADGNIIHGILPFSIPTVWRLVAKGDLPRPYKLSSGVTAWNMDEIDDWQRAKQEAKNVTA